MIRIQLLLGLLITAFAASSVARAEDDTLYHMYVGTYTSGDSEGIYRLDWNPATGKMGAPFNYFP